MITAGASNTQNPTNLSTILIPTMIDLERFKLQTSPCSEERTC